MLQPHIDAFFFLLFYKPYAHRAGHLVEFTCVSILPSKAPISGQLRSNENHVQ